MVFEPCFFIPAPPRGRGEKEKWYDNYLFSTLIPQQSYSIAGHSEKLFKKQRFQKREGTSAFCSSSQLANCALSLYRERDIIQVFYRRLFAHFLSLSIGFQSFGQTK